MNKNGQIQVDYSVNGIKKKLIKEAAAYTVSLYAYQKKALERSAALIPICDGTILTLMPEYYDDVIGLITTPKQQTFLEV